MSTSASSNPNAVVVGAGAVGVCTARYLQRAGFKVMVLDPEPPGEGASQGNAGILSGVAVIPEGTPRTLLQVPKMLLDRSSPLAIRWRYLPRLAPWLLRLLRASTPARVEHIAGALYALTSRAIEAYGPLLADARADDLVRLSGWICVYGSAADYAEAKWENDLKRRLGLSLEDLGGDAVRQMVPALAPEIGHGTFMSEVAMTVNPLRLVQTLARDIQNRGGLLLSERVTGFELGQAGVASVRTESRSYPADLVVIAAGAYSGPLAAGLGSRVPLDTERGYHVMLPKPGVEVRLPIQSHDGGYVVTPMEHGLRVAGTVEFARLDAPPNYARAEALLGHARRLLPGLQSDGMTMWMGHRPSMPDSLPVLGRSPHHGNVYFAFGHGRIGLTLAALSGRIIADLARGRAPEIDLTPYRADRF